MNPILIELNPNRILLDSNFDGYKLSLQEIPKKKKELSTFVDRVLLNSQQYSLLHANLYGLHNHLVEDPYDESNSVYFVDSGLNICKLYIDPFNDELIDPISLLKLPRSRDRKAGDYNVSLKFVSPSLAVIGDGIGTLFIIDTGCRNDDDQFTICFSDEVAGHDEPFLIVDAVVRTAKDSNPQLHVLALSLKKEHKNERFFTILHWVTFSKVQDVWGQIALKQIKTKGGLQYSRLETHCESVYLVSDAGCSFILNSDVPILIPTEKSELEKVYKWSQNIEDITIKIVLPDNTLKEQIKVESESLNIKIKCGDKVLVVGSLYKNIDADMTSWTFENSVLEVIINKSEAGDMWPELIKNDTTGEYLDDNCIVDDDNRLTRFTSDNEEIPQAGTTFNSQQVEECDFEIDKTAIFERLCCKSNSTTHRVNLGSHQVLLTACLTPGFPPAIGIRHDVDICLWQPQLIEENFSIKHEGTLLALGYVQASKQNRKFTVCPPNMNYAVICESSGHLFIYRQKKSVSSTELRNRSTGKKVHNIAQQQVVNLSNEEVLGIYASNSHLFLLFEKNITVLNL